MNKVLRLATLVILFISTSNLYAQTRLNTHEQIGWYNFFGTFKLADKWSLHTEYQWRRSDFIGNWQQSLIRTRSQLSFESKGDISCRIWTDRNLCLW